MADEIDQSKSTVGGDQVGRDKVTNISYGAVPTERAFLTREAVQSFKLEVVENVELGATIAALQHFLDSVDVSDVNGLEAKLTLADRKAELREAEKFKELFAMKLHRRQFSPTAQEVYAYLLGEMNQRFKYRVRPLIDRHAPRDEVDTSVYEEILRPIADIVETHSLRVLPQEVQGMLYFLTGNCHITWH